MVFTDLRVWTLLQVVLPPLQKKGCDSRLPCQTLPPPSLGTMSLKRFDFFLKVFPKRGGEPNDVEGIEEDEAASEEDARLPKIYQIDKAH